MFNFLLTGEFWLETITQTIITAAGTIAVALIGVILSNRKLKSDLILKMTEKDELLKSLINEKNSSLSAGVSNTHNNLSREHDGITNTITTIKKELNTVSSQTSYLRDETLKTAVQKEILSQKELNITETINHITSLMEIVSELKQKVAVLEFENQKLKEEKQNYKKHSTDYDIDNDYEMEF